MDTKNTLIVTIHPLGYNIVARREDGSVLARRKTDCNPSALDQLILDCEMAGAQIDWNESVVAQPTEA